jgi:hypothetical protein
MIQLCRAVTCSATVLLIGLQCAWAATSQLSGKVADENSLAVAGAQISLNGAALAEALYATSDETGRFQLGPLSPGVYELKVEKRGFYAFVSHSIEVGTRATSIEVTLNHQQEYEETVNVVYSAPTIDREEAAAQTTLTSEEIINLPSPASHDFRNVLPLMPGVVKDNAGRIHVNGGGENQAFYSLDGFNITNPVSGILENRISIDAIRSVRVEASRFSAEHGKGSTGAMLLETKVGDDHFRFSSTNFVPSFEIHDGLAISNWNPRVTFSGPIVKGRMWYFNAMDLQYDLNIVDALPPTANTNRNWFGSNLTRLQFNLTNSNIITGSFLFNFQNSRHFGLTALDPVETSRNRQERFYFINIKDVAYLSGGWVLETGLGVNKVSIRERPLGEDTYTVSPEGRSGNYFLQSKREVDRVQWLASVLVPSWSWHGRHTVKFGMDANAIDYRQFASRRPLEVHRSLGSRARTVTFSGQPDYGRTNFEISAYVQDRWSPSDRLLVEAGLRLDWDQILRESLWSPRLAATWSPTRAPYTKFSAGIGVFYDASNLGMLTRELDQERSDTFYDEAGTNIVQGPIRSSYRSDERELKAPYYLNWSAGWEQKLPRSFYFRSNFIRKHGRRGWSYDLVSPLAGQNVPLSVFQLGNQRSDSYRYLELTLTRTFRDKYPWLLSYARSSARSSAVLDFSQDNPVFARQGSGPLDWDVPNRLITWAFLPLPRVKRYTVTYFLEWHSGFPHGVVDQYQYLVGPPNSSRFPDYFSVNLHVERRFRLLRKEWALRAGFQNLTGHHNPVVVNNNINSPNFGTYGYGQGRVFTGRIRFLGRN